MPIKRLPISDFLELAATSVVFDVRSPGEYEHAHIPEAYSLPLFSDEERKIVGTAYKQEGRQPAIKHGLRFFGPKMNSFVETVESVFKNNPQFKDQTVLVHCWRGGMRSAAVAWLLDLYGFTVYTLDGGYKAYRNEVLQLFEKPYSFNIIGGYTGSDKTGMLHQLHLLGEPIIDLEKLAVHKGSAFGGLGMEPQPSQEMFENKLAAALLLLPASSNPSAMVWIEDESQRIGRLHIPHSFWANMRLQPVYFFDIPFEERLDHIVTGYGSLDTESLITAVSRIHKRLGPLETKNCLQHLHENNYREAFRILLSYYDKTYIKGLQNRENPTLQVRHIQATSVDAAANTQKLIACSVTTS